MQYLPETGAFQCPGFLKNPQGIGLHIIRYANHSEAGDSANTDIVFRVILEIKWF